MKKLIILSMLILALFLGACSNTKEPLNNQPDEYGLEITEVITVHGSRLGYQTLQKFLEPITVTNFEGDEEWIEDHSVDLIVIGEFVEGTEDKFIYSYNDYFGKDVVVDASATNQLLITDVLKGKIKAGEIITITERYSFDETRGALIIFGELTPMHKGDKWIYFLKHLGGDMYYTAGDSDGRYPIPNKEIMQALSEFPKETLAIYTNFDRKNGEKIGKMYDEARERAFEKIDLGLLGVIDRYDFNFALYSEVLEHFKIETQEWVNPGRELDTRLIELYENPIIDNP